MSNVHLKLWGTGLAGVLVGVLVTMGAVRVMMPGMMLVTTRSAYGLEETCQRLKTAIEETGWRCPAIRDMNAAVAKEGVAMNRQVRIVELCKADYAKAVLETDPQVSTLMPCAFGVYEQDGGVYVTAMNTELMGKMMGGNIARVMGVGVAADEHRILECLR
jgi:uncharacterized protein (DUF302 family)